MYQQLSNKIRIWNRGVPMEAEVYDQIAKLESVDCVRRVAIMPDAHVGIGSTVGSVIATKSAIIPAAVGVDIGCGMIAARTSLTADDLPDNLAGIRSAIEAAVPHGRSTEGADPGAWNGRIPQLVQHAWATLAEDFRRLTELHPRLSRSNNINHLGTLGTGNHFVEICLDQDNAVWIMLHSGSRGVGNAIGSHFIRLAQEDMRQHIANLPNKDLAYFTEGSQHFDDYVFGVSWAQRFAAENRNLMMTHAVQALSKIITKPFSLSQEAVNCHHNYVQLETHAGEDVFVTRKGAVSARVGQLGIIPGSMGAKSFIVRGLGNADSMCSCSHGAGRVMSRTRAKQLISVEDHIRATQHVECRKDVDVVDESPAAYKSIDAVMEAQSDLVEIVHTLRQVVCVKG